MKAHEGKAYKGVILAYIILILTALIVILYLLFSHRGAKIETFRNLGFDQPLTKSQVFELSLESKYMDRSMPYIIYLPKGYGNGAKYPVWYGLNSYSSKQDFWINNGIDTAADELIDAGEIEPIVMVFPYTKDSSLKEIEKDLEDGIVDERNFDQFLSKELIPYIDSHYFTVAKPEGRFIGGFSLGGMIALRIAFHHTDLFGKVGGYSAGVLYDDYSGSQLEEWLYPNDDIDDIDTFDKKKGFQNLIVQLDAGNSNDPFAVGLASLHEALQKRGISSEFELFDGGHTLRRNKTKDYLKFYVRKD
jgi:enterochelin esterase-like enzyme